MIPTALWLLFDFFFFENDVNVPLKSKKLFFYLFFVGILKVNYENSRIQITADPLVRGMDTRIQIHTRSTPKCHGSATPESIQRKQHVISSNSQYGFRFGSYRSSQSERASCGSAFLAFRYWIRIKIQGCFSDTRSTPILSFYITNTTAVKCSLEAPLPFLDLDLQWTRRDRWHKEVEEPALPNFALSCLTSSEVWTTTSVFRLTSDSSALFSFSSVASLACVSLPNIQEG